ncbi:MAG: AraC family transcriptional regulator [Methylocella sp.]
MLRRRPRAESERHNLNFSSHANFTRAFRRIVGQTPSQFRRSGLA